uniref:Uncharacterized protein LOC102808924 n=1 Tax=Saccoglossus kowalevskii TaxID=10224 RepID=A0ABM0MNE4_SACKO
MDPNRRQRKVLPQRPFYALPPEQESCTEIVNKARKTIKTKEHRGTNTRTPDRANRIQGTDHHSMPLDFVLTGAGMGIKPERLPPVGTRAPSTATPDVPKETATLQTLLKDHIHSMETILHKSRGATGSRDGDAKKTFLTERYEQILNGDFEGDIPNIAKVVRIFLSSTFTDTTEERNCIMFRAVPKLKRFCQERGYEFQRIENYVRGEIRQPLVVYGPSGCGKTSIVAMAATKTRQWLGGKCNVVLRLKKELTAVQRSPPFGITVYLPDDNLHVWNAEIKGPAGSLYE